VLASRMTLRRNTLGAALRGATLCAVTWCAAMLCAAVPAVAQTTLHPGRLAPSTMSMSEVEGGAVATVGPGDTLYMTVYGRPELSVQVTVDVDGRIVVPFIGPVAVATLSPTQVGQRIAEQMKTQGYLRDPQIAVEVVRVRSRMVSLLGEIARPGRYPLEGQMTLLELLAVAGGPKDLAEDHAVVLRRGATPDAAQQRLQIAIGNRQLPSLQIQDMALQPGDIVYLPQVARFFVYGEVGKSGAYPMEAGLDVMRALALAGGLNARASDRRIDISRKDATTGETRKMRVRLTDPVQPGDVIHVDERIF